MLIKEVPIQYQQFLCMFRARRRVGGGRPWQRASQQCSKPCSCWAFLFQHTSNCERCSSWLCLGRKLSDANQVKSQSGPVKKLLIGLLNKQWESPAVRILAHWGEL